MRCFIGYLTNFRNWRSSTTYCRDQTRLMCQSRTWKTFDIPSYNFCKANFQVLMYAYVRSIGRFFMLTLMLERCVRSSKFQYKLYIVDLFVPKSVCSNIFMNWLNYWDRSANVYSNLSVHFYKCFPSNRHRVTFLQNRNYSRFTTHDPNFFRKFINIKRNSSQIPNTVYKDEVNHFHPDSILNAFVSHCDCDTQRIFNYHLALVILFQLLLVILTRVKYSNTLKSLTSGHHPLPSFFLTGWIPCQALVRLLKIIAPFRFWITLPKFLK